MFEELWRYGTQSSLIGQLLVVDVLLGFDECVLTLVYRAAVSSDVSPPNMYQNGKYQVPGAIDWA